MAFRRAATISRATTACCIAFILFSLLNISSSECINGDRDETTSREESTSRQPQRSLRSSSSQLTDPLMHRWLQQNTTNTTVVSSAPTKAPTLAPGTCPAKDKCRFLLLSGIRVHKYRDGGIFCLEGCILNFRRYFLERRNWQCGSCPGGFRPGSPPSSPVAPTKAPAIRAPTKAPAIRIPTKAPSTSASTTRAPTMVPFPIAPGTSQQPANIPAQGPMSAPSPTPVGAPTPPATSPVTGPAPNSVVPIAATSPITTPFTAVPAPVTLPTTSTTAAPTKRPTAAPTKQPTAKPTLTPVTAAPTKQPTKAPTRQPTTMPTKTPTTRSPTAMPSRDVKVIITEIMMIPDANDNLDSEWFEVYNAGMDTVNLKNWIVTDDTSTWTINTTVTILPGKYAVLMSSRKADTNRGFTPNYILADLDLDDVKDTITLKRPDGSIEDEVPYNAANGGDWNVFSAASLSLKDLTLDNFDPGSWCESGGTPYGGINKGTPGAAHVVCA